MPDLPGSDTVDAFLASGRQVSGQLDAKAVERLSEDPLARIHEDERRPEVVTRMLQQ